MPPVPIRKALRCCLGGRLRHANAMTTALSPLRITLITAIFISAIQISRLVRCSKVLPPSLALV